MFWQNPVNRCRLACQAVCILALHSCFGPSSQKAGAAYVAHNIARPSLSVIHPLPVAARPDDPNLAAAHTYRPDIDGLRAVAVLLVIGFHAFPSMLPGGFTGVDIFFVISGFLITSIIVEALMGGRFSFAVFYMRRVRRIFPALLAVLAVCLGVGWLYCTADEYRLLGKHVAAGAAFVSNLALMQESGYFDLAAETKPLLHLWSLGVEEQFYMILPPLLWLAWRLRAGMLPAVIVIAAISFWLAVSGLFDPVVTFFSPQTRIWELLLGSLLALLQIGMSSDGSGLIGRRSAVALRWLANLGTPGLRSLLSLACLLGLALSIVLVTRAKPVPGWWSLLPVMSAVLIIAVGPGAWANRTLLACKPLVAIGLISYPLYLWHWPLLVFATLLEGTRPSIAHRLVAIILAFGLSIATYFMIERPLRFGARGQIKALLLACAMALAGLAGYRVYVLDGVPTRDFAVKFKNVSDAVEDFEFSAGLLQTSYQGQSVLANTTRPPQVLFIGDSHIEQFFPGVVSLTREGRFPPSIFMGSGGCPPIPNVREDSLARCQATLASINRVLEEPGSIRQIVIGGCWNCYFLEETRALDAAAGGFSYYYAKGDVRIPFRLDKGADLAIAGLGEFLGRLSSRFDVYLLLDNPLGSVFNPKHLIGNRLSFQGGGNLGETTPIPADQAALNERLRQVARAAGARVIDQLPVLCPQDQCVRLTPDKRPIYKDDHHMRPFFVRQAAGLLERALHEPE